MNWLFPWFLCSFRYLPLATSKEQQVKIWRKRQINFVCELFKDYIEFASLRVQVKYVDGNYFLKYNINVPIAERIYGAICPACRIRRRNPCWSHQLMERKIKRQYSSDAHFVLCGSCNRVNLCHRFIYSVHQRSLPVFCIMLFIHSFMHRQYNFLDVTPHVLCQLW